MAHLSVSSVLLFSAAVLLVVVHGATHDTLNWSPYTQSRKTPQVPQSSVKTASSRETSVDPSAAPLSSFDVYSTLPQIPHQDTPSFEQQQPQNNFQGFQQHFPQQQHQQPQFFDPSSFSNYQPTGQGFEQTNEIEEEPGLFSRVMDFFGISGFFNRMSAAWATLTGSSDDAEGSSFMSRIAMPMMLLPMAAIPVGMGIMGLLAFPVLQLSLPVVRRSLSSTAALTSEVLGSEECMERISCTLARAAKRLPYEEWISSKLDKSENKWLSRMGKSLKAARALEGECREFQCGSVSKLERLVVSFIPQRKREGNVLKSESPKTS